MRQQEEGKGIGGKPAQTQTTQALLESLAGAVEKRKGGSRLPLLQALTCSYIGSGCDSGIPLQSVTG